MPLQSRPELFPQQDPASADPRSTAEALLFVVAPEAALPQDPGSVEELEQAQRLGIGSAMALRMFRSPAHWQGSLDDLVSEGCADVQGLDPFALSAAASASAAVVSAEPGQPPERRRLICDAVVPHLEARSHWLGVYAVSGARAAAMPARNDTDRHPIHSLAIDSVRCLDRFALREADNETCWFYPTDDGSFLAWENQRRVETLPGFLPERPVQEEPVVFQRSDLRVLWSLMADDLALTCVGLTCRGRRIEWPVHRSQPEPFATWTAFAVDSAAETTYSELAAITVFQS